MTLNDFKSVEGDRRIGIGSLPVRLGAERAARVACVVMAVPQVVVVGAAAGLGRAAGMPPRWRRCCSAQLALMARLLRDPRGLRALVQRHGRDRST